MKRINLTVFLLSISFVYQILIEWRFLIYLLIDALSIGDFTLLLYFAPLLSIPTAAFLFWKKKKSGWFFLSILSICITINATLGFAASWSWDKSHGNDLGELDRLFPNPLLYLITIALFGTVLWLITRSDIRDVFHIDKKTAFGTIGITALLISTVIFAIL